MTSKVKVGVRKVSEWISTIAGAAGDTVEFAVESGFLQDTLKEICDRAGVVFKLGAMTIPKDKLEADAEYGCQRGLSTAWAAALPHPGDRLANEFRAVECDAGGNGSGQ